MEAKKIFLSHKGGVMISRLKTFAYQVIHRRQSFNSVKNTKKTAGLKQPL
jgi:hypothetical protein